MIITPLLAAFLGMAQAAPGVEWQTQDVARVCPVKEWDRVWQYLENDGLTQTDWESLGGREQEAFLKKRCDGAQQYDLYMTANNALLTARAHVDQATDARKYDILKKELYGEGDYNLGLRVEAVKERSGEDSTYYREVRKKLDGLQKMMAAETQKRQTAKEAARLDQDPRSVDSVRRAGGERSARAEFEGNNRPDSNVVDISRGPAPDVDRPAEAGGALIVKSDKIQPDKVYVPVSRPKTDREREKAYIDRENAKWFRWFQDPPEQQLAKMHEFRAKCAQDPSICNNEDTKYQCSHWGQALHGTSYCQGYLLLQEFDSK